MDTYGLAINDDLGELRRKMSGEDPHVGSLIPDFEYFDHYQRIMPDANPKDNANVLICNAAASYTFFDLSEVVRLEPDVVIPDGYTEETLLIDPFLSVLVRELISNVWVAQFETYRALRAIPEFAALREL